MKGEQAATVAYLVAGLLALLSVAGVVHAGRSPKERAVRTSPVRVTAADKHLLPV